MKKECKAYFAKYLRAMRNVARASIDSEKLIANIWVSVLATRLAQELKYHYKTDDIEELLDLVRYQTGVDKRTLRRFIEQGKMPHPRVLERIVLYSNRQLVLQAVPLCTNDRMVRVSETVSSPGLIKYKLNALVLAALIRSGKHKAGSRARSENKLLRAAGLPVDDQLLNLMERYGKALPNIVQGKAITFAAAQLILRKYGMRLMISIEG